MNDGGGPLLSVRAEARQLVAPDYAVVDGLIEHTTGSKAEAVRSVADSLDRLTADLATLGAVPFDAGAGRRPLTWSAHSWTAQEEFYHDKETMRMERSGRVTATVALQVTVRDLDALDGLSGLLAAHPGLKVHGVTWQVDWDNAPYHTVRSMAFRASGGGNQPETPRADSCSAGAHRDHRGSLPHHRRVPARRLRPPRAAGRQLTEARD